MVKILNISHMKFCKVTEAKELSLVKRNKCKKFCISYNAKEFRQKYTKFANKFFKKTIKRVLKENIKKSLKKLYCFAIT